MDNGKIGMFIAEQRKKITMTQKELADRLGVTDKAVSKWERGAGYPDITLIPKLAELLRVSTGELLSGEPDQKSTPDTENALLKNTIAYAEKSSRFHTMKTANGISAGVTAAFALALFVCLIVNFAVNKELSWSLYPTGSLAFAWLILIPFIKAKKHRTVAALMGLTLSVFPFLLLIEHLAPVKGWVLPLGLPILLMSLPSLWFAAWLWLYSGMNRFYAAALSAFLYGVVLNISINNRVAHFLNTDNTSKANFIVTASFGLLSLVFIILGILKKAANKRTGD